MPQLFERLRTNGNRTIAYPIHEKWMDVGRPEELLRANEVPGDSNQGEN
jgi:NDP-sugar pyrophosphorylase family protein